MIHYFVEADIRDGEHEYRQKSTMVQPKRQTEKQMKRFVEKWFGFGKGSYQIVTLANYQEISKEDYELLRKYHI